MTNKKFLLGEILAAAVCLTACSTGGTEVSETISETVTAAAETTSAASETTAETTTVTTTAETESIDTSGVEYMKEALQAEWDDSEYDRFAVSVVNLYTADLNGDGIDELFVNYSFGAAMNGLVYVYDVSDGMKKLYEISSRMWAEKSELYEDESGTVHLILKEGYAGGTGEMDKAYFDITYDSIKMPIYIKEYDWYDGGAHVFAYDLYKNCEFVPLNYINNFSGWRNFDREKAEYIGRYDWDDVSDAMNDGKNNEISNIIQKEVYEGMTYISDVYELYEGSIRHKDFEDFDGFWQEAAPKLAEVYGGTASTESIDTSGVEYMKEALKTDWENSAASKDNSGLSGMTAAGLYTVDLNGDGVKELLADYIFGDGIDGFVCVYDVSDGVKKLHDISARIWADKAELYTDTDGNLHFILANGYSTWQSTYDYAFFDITYDSIKIPFYVDDYQYHDDVGHVFKSDIYTNCEVVPNVEKFKGWRNFDPEKAEYIGRFDADYVMEAIDYGKSNEISEIIQKEVYEGLTYVSDIEKICESSGNIRDYKFEEFWQEAAPKLVEVYGGTASTEIIDTIGVEYMKEALQADWNDPFGIELYAADLNGDGVKELFKTDYFAAGWYGLTYVYDVSDGTKKLFTAAARIWQDGDSGIYSDESGGIHLIVKEDYPGCSHYSDTAYFDITYDSVKMPLFTRIIKGENEYENSIYTYCEVIPSFCDDEYSSWRNFDPKSCKYAEKYDGTEYTDENGKMEELIENTVYNGLTFVSELEEFYKGSIQDFEDFDSFWQEASPKLAEIYCE